MENNFWRQYSSFQIQSKGVKISFDNPQTGHSSLHILIVNPLRGALGYSDRGGAVAVQLTQADVG